MKKNGWVHFNPQTFDEYCRRLQLLLNCFGESQIFKYEDFVGCPQKQMEIMTHVLNVPYSDSFEDIFGLFKVTGDSGRTSDFIRKRTRVIDDSILKESKNSEKYTSIADKYGYKKP